MAAPTSQISRPMILTSAGVVAAAVTVAVYAVVRGASPAALPPGRCDVTSTVSASADPAERPISVLRDASSAWVLLVSPKAGATDGTVRVRVARVPDESATTIVHTVEAPSLEAVSRFVRRPDGIAYAIARRETVTAYVISPSSVVRERVFPHGEQSPGRATLTPAITLAAARDGALSVLARYPAPYGTVRLHDRDVHESDGYTPRRADGFRAPDVAVTRDAVLLAQEHVAGSFSGAAPRSSVELVALDPSPAHPDLRSTTTLNREGTTGSHPRVALLDPDASGAGAVVVWRDEHGLAATRALPDPDHTWKAHESMRVLDAQRPDEGVTGDHDVASTGRACASIAAWRSGADLALRAFDVTRGLTGDVVRIALPAGEGASRVRVERSGARVFLAADTAAGPKVFEATVTDACALTATPLTLPAAASAAGVRIAGFAASSNVAVLGLTRAAVDARESPMVFVTLAADATRPTTLAPPAVTLRQGVSELTMFAGDVPVAVGRARGSVMLQRIGGSGDEDGPGEDLLLRGMRGEDLAVDASATLHRVWVADVAGDEETPFGPPRAVVLQSAIDALEDGPRTEVRTATVPFAEFSGVSLASLTNAGDAAWGATLSGATGGDCMAGAWATLRDANDRALGDRQAVPLVAQGDGRCGDRVLSALWEGSRLAATITGERIGARLATGDVRGAEMHTVALDDRAGAAPRLASVVAARNGLLALWLDGSARTPSLRYRMFTRDGVARTGVETLGEISEAPGETSAGEVIPLAGEGERFAAALRTAHGPRVARLSCGAVP